MEKHILLIAILSSILFSCSKTNEYTIAGRINEPGYEGKTVYLYPQKDSEIAIDSTTVENGQFSFNGIAPDTVKLTFFTHDERFSPQAFVIEKGNINLLIDSTDWNWFKISGTPLNDEFNAYKVEFNNLMQRSQPMGKEMEEAYKNPNITEAEKEKWEQIKDSVINEIEDHIYNYAAKHSQDGLGEYIFRNDTYFMKPQKMKNLLTLFRPEFINKTSPKLAYLDAQIATSEGNPYTDVSGFDIDGKEIAFSDFVGKGKVVLIDFWASWCGPCIASLPELKTFYEKNKNKGLVILGVSLDSNKDSWLKATEKHDIKWPQLSNLKGMDDPAAQKYGIRGIPHTVFIDQEGIIIGQNLPIEQMQNKFDELTR